jgi:hypothetical protein
MSARYIDDVGFVLISLFDGFVIVGAMDLGAPTAVVAVGGIISVVIGIRCIETVKSRTGARH